jgi:asparagine synthetase B (glutamine-hydrolysing)
LGGAYLPKPIAQRLRRRSASPYVASEVIDDTLVFWPTAPAFASGSIMRRELLLETFVTSLPPLLRYADRSSMAHAREVRLPYLDRRVAEFALSLPTDFLCHRNVTKRILRDAARGFVPDRILARGEKIAFEPPERRWLSTPAWRERVAAVLLDPATLARGIYDAGAIEQDLRAGSWRDHGAIWRAFCAETWRHTFAAARSIAGAG